MDTQYMIDTHFIVAQDAPLMRTPQPVVVHEPGRIIDTQHGFIRGWGVTASTSGAQNISMAAGVLPAGVRATAHYHPFETALYILAGTVRVFWGASWADDYVDVEAGDFIYIPAWVIHSPMNLGSTPMEYVVARNAPEEVAFTVERAA